MMSDRFTRALLLAIAVFMAVFALGPYIDRWMYATTEPRAVVTRGDLAEFEKASIAVFRTVAPSASRQFLTPRCAAGSALETNP